MPSHTVSGSFPNTGPGECRTRQASRPSQSPDSLEGVRTHLGYTAVGAVVLGALMVFVIAIGAPLWLEILSLVAAGAVWLRYRWKYTGWRESHREGVARARAAGLEKRREREVRKRRRP